MTAFIHAKVLLQVLCLTILFPSKCDGQMDIVEIQNHSHSLRGGRMAQSEFVDVNSKDDGDDEERKLQDRLQQKRRIVLIAGPHKTGSSSIQNNMYRWMTVTKDGVDEDKYEDVGQMNDVILPSWSWPGPNIIYDVCSEDSEKEYMHGKIFYPFVEALHNCKFAHRKIADYYTCKELLDLYKFEIQYKWDKGYNLAIGTEAFDLVGSFQKDGLKIADIIQHMPTNTTLDDFTVVIKYRSPRVSHLISWYHECCMKDMSFRTFLVNEMTKFSHRGSRIIDSLLLVQKFLTFGLNVTLIDISGVHEQGYDLSNVIACDVMDVPCTDKKTIIGDNVSPEIKNVKKGGSFDFVTDEHLDKIEKIIRRRDCRFQYLRKHPKLNILYAKDIFDIFDACDDDDGISRQEMSNEIYLVGKEILSKANDS